MQIARRAFLRMGGGVLLTAGFSRLAIAAPDLANVPLPVAAPERAPAVIGTGLSQAECRTLAFSSIHTGESCKVDYWVEGDYVVDAMAAISRVLRDHRTGEVLAIDVQLLDRLAALRATLGTEKPFQLISGYRSPHSNAALRSKSGEVAEKSLHMLGKATDVKIAGVSLKDINTAAQAQKAGGTGFYPVSGFVHVDSGRVRSWSGA